MSYPHADPDRFEQLLAHVERHLGPVTHGQGPLVDWRNRGFAVGFHRHRSISMVSAATTGVRFQRVEAVLPVECVVSALPEQEDEAAYLVHVGAARVIENGRGYAYGQGYLNAEPLIPGTGIEFLLAWTHLATGPEFDVFHDEYGDPALRFVTFVPATRAEYEQVWAQRGPDALFRLWETQGTNLFDLYRPCAVTA